MIENLKSLSSGCIFVCQKTQNTHYLKNCCYEKDLLTLALAICF